MPWRDASTGSGCSVRTTSDNAVDNRAGVGIEVADTGIGMTAEVIERIFDPFFTTKRQQGTGLGLSICRTLIDRQGGSIAVDSGLGRGTTFTLWLPEAE